MQLLSYGFLPANWTCTNQNGGGGQGQIQGARAPDIHDNIKRALKKALHIKYQA